MEPMPAGRFEQTLERRLLKAFETGRVLPYLITTMVVIVFAFATVMRIFDQADFKTYGDALWWAVATVTTVGYGDIVPKTAVGRTVASLLMITGFAFLSLITGTIASVLVARFTRTRSDERVVQALARLEERLERLEQRPPA
jgi:voltage-gated potassium channel Kch